MSSSIRRSALLVDPHPLWLDQVEQVLARAGFDVAGKAVSTADALEQLAERRPDVVVAEIHLPAGDPAGADFVRRVRACHPELKVVVLSTFDDGEHIESAFDAGADAYVLKTASPEDIVSAVRIALNGSIFVARARFARATPPAAALPAPEVVATAAEDLAGLTRREMEILTLVAEGHSNAALARMLWVTEQTVKFHLSNIYRKLDVANRTEASRWAQLRGLLPGRQPQAA
jgi:DNA-binding NarL/FixJ family response regulator